MAAVEFGPPIQPPIQPRNRRAARASYGLKSRRGQGKRDADGDTPPRRMGHRRFDSRPPGRADGRPVAASDPAVTSRLSRAGPSEAVIPLLILPHAPPPAASKAAARRPNRSSFTGGHSAVRCLKRTPCAPLVIAAAEARRRRLWPQAPACASAGSRRRRQPAAAASEARSVRRFEPRWAAPAHRVVARRTRALPAWISWARGAARAMRPGASLLELLAVLAYYDAVALAKRPAPPSWPLRAPRIEGRGRLAVQERGHLRHGLRLSTARSPDGRPPRKRATTLPEAGAHHIRPTEQARARRSSEADITPPDQDMNPR